jgi:predicted permease
MIGGLWQDLRYGASSLRRTPTFTVSAVLTLALGIGASTTIFGLFEAVMMRRLPVARPEQLYFVAHGSPDGQGTGSNYPYFERMRSAAEGLADVTAYDLESELKVSSGASTEITLGQYVSGNYHRVLGVPMLLGRGFVDEGDRRSDGAPTVVISAGYWSRAFGRDPDVLGKSLVVNGRQAAIVGVTAAGFEGLDPGYPVDVTVPMSFKALEEPGFFTTHDTWFDMNVVARLGAGVTPERALSAFDGAFQRFFSEPENAQWRQGEGARNFANAWLLSAEAGMDDLRDRYARSLQVLLSMVGLLLVIACANVANLLLARGSVRSKEVAVRLAIGAGRGRVARQLLVESIQLSLIAGALGWMLAQVGVDVILALLAMGQNPILLSVEPNASVLAFTIGVSALTGIAFGLAPAFGLTGIDLTHALRSVGRSERRHGSWSTRHVLVAGQIALCVLLVYGAGLLARTLYGLDSRDGGFDRSNVLMFTVDASGTAFPARDLPRFCDELIERTATRVRWSRPVGRRARSARASS